MVKLKDSNLIPEIKYKSRRGMLELDLLFNNFLSHCFNTLDAEQHPLFYQMLEEIDPVLFDYFFNDVETTQYSHFIHMIKDCNQHHVSHHHPHWAIQT